MSFSADVKAELCREKLTRRCCAQAETCGVLLYCNAFSPREVRVVTESSPFAARLPLLFRKAFGVEFDPAPGESQGKHIFTLSDPRHLSQIWEVWGYDVRRSPSHHINFAMLEEDHCRTAFLRGAFLAGGSVTDPGKGYHLELVTSHLHVSRELSALLQEAGFSPKGIARRSNYVTYFKQSECIEDLLTALGAPISAMEIMNAKVEKTLRSGINRRVNCDAANADKTVDAAFEQVAAIRTLEAAGLLTSLPPKLRETAALRVAHPELSLIQLAELCDPPVTKSCLNHRLRRLLELAR